MRFVRRFALVAALAAGAVLIGFAPNSHAGDWPQWRGPNRDGKATDFKAPDKWPKELTKKWSVTVGDGVGTPALVDGKLYVFTREAGNEVTRCLNADTGKEVWKNKNDVEFKSKGGDGNWAGPRASVAVSGGNVVTFGVNGTLSCLKTADGEKVWRVDTGAFPKFHTACSPLIVGKFVIVQVGSEGTGGINAYNLTNGDLEWSWTDDGPQYASPIAMTIGDKKTVVTQTAKNLVAVGVDDGKTVWKTVYNPGTGPGQYNATTPMIDGQTVIFSGVGRGTKAIKIEKKDNSFITKDVWSNRDNSALYNSPVLKKGFVYGLTKNDALFCVNAADGKTAWTHSLTGRGGYGSVVDAGAVLFALTPTGKLIVFEPNEKEYTEIATYKVADSDAYAYPIVTGNRIYTKDKNALVMWTTDEK